MTEATAIVAALAKTTDNFAVYESANEGDRLTGMYVSLEAFGGDPLEFINVNIGDDQPVDLRKIKDTSNYGRYESEDGRTISGAYFAHDDIGSEDTEDGPEAPDSLGVGVSGATEDDFEATVEETEEDEPEAEDADALVVEDDSEEEETQEDELVEVDDEELELAEN